MDKQQIKARFFGMHIGCKCRYENAFSGSTTTELAGYDGEMVVLNGKDGQYLFDIDNCKLSLRPLSSLTDQEAVECLNLIDVDSPDEMDVFFIKRSLRAQKLGSLYEMQDVINLIDYLRSKNFALQFMGLDPIKEGWAVLDEKISANETEKTA